MTFEPLDPSFRALIEAAAAAEMPPLTALPAELVREGYRQQRIGIDPGAADDLSVSDLQVAGGEGPIGARLYVPPGAPDVGPGHVHFHGGGFVIGDLDTHDAFLRRLCAGAGVKVLAIDYRLAPEHPFPAAHDDALAAVRWAFDHAAEIGFDPARISVGGDSAGGNLAASVALAMRTDDARRLAFQLLLYPCLAMACDTPSRAALADGYLLTAEVMAWFGDHLAADGHPDASRAAPHLAPNLAGSPPALVVTAGYDLLQDEGRLYAERLRAAGGIAEHRHFPTFVHDFYIMAGLCPVVIPAITETAQALGEALA
jgi:acetyl esterase